MRSSSWWRSASTEQRLKQIEAGIELGMTARQIALASGAPVNDRRSYVMFFGNKHGRSFPNPKAVKSMIARRRDAAKRFLRGERVGFFEPPPDPDEFRLDEVEDA